MESLQPLPPTFVATRDALHRVAEEIVAPGRKPHNEIALRQTPGGFGTPEFEWQGAPAQVRVDGAELVVTRGGDEHRTPLTSLAEAAALVGPDLLPDGPPDDRMPLAIDPEAAARLAEFYAFTAEVLEHLRESLDATDDASAINLWPEHFDIAFEAGAADAGLRANYGGSPGDEQHAEPYLYIGPWTAEVTGPLWNAVGFTGAELTYAELLAADDPERTALDFFRTRRDAMRGE